MNEPTPADVVARLDALGSHAAIAAHLRERGIRGVYDNGSQCPIARYVTAETGRVVVVTASVWIDDIDGDGPNHYTPDNVSDFVTMFDCEYYSDLAEGEPS